MLGAPFECSKPFIQLSAPPREFFLHFPIPVNRVNPVNPVKKIPSSPFTQLSAPLRESLPLLNSVNSVNSVKNPTPAMHNVS